MFVKSLKFSTYNTITNRDNFMTFFPIWMTFTYFSCLISLGRPSNTTLSDERGNSSLVPDFRKKVFSVALLNMMFGLDFLCVALFCWGSFLLFPVCWVFIFIMKVCLILSIFFSVSFEMITWFSPLQFLKILTQGHFFIAFRKRGGERNINMRKKHQ